MQIVVSSCRSRKDYPLACFLRPILNCSDNAASARTFRRGEEANFLKSTAKRGLRTGETTPSACPTRSRPLSVSPSHTRFLSIRSRVHASCWRSLGCQLVFLALQQDTNHLRPHPRHRASRTHDVPHRHTLVRVSHLHMRSLYNRQPPAGRERAFVALQSAIWLTISLILGPRRRASRGSRGKARAG